MFRTLAAFVTMITLFGLGIAIAAWPRAAASESFASEGQLMLAYGRVHEGMDVARAAALGFNPSRARHLSALGLMERFMPKDSFAFDTLEPVVQGCFQGSPGCDAYVFPVAEGRAQAVLLVSGGKVAWKSITGMKPAPAAKRVAAR